MSERARIRPIARGVPLKPLTPEEKQKKEEDLKNRLQKIDRETMEHHVEELRTEAEKYDRLLKLQKEFPDLRVDVDRWKNVRYMSASVNGKCNQFEWRRTCGCCPDAGLLAMPYVETTLGKIYSNPVSPREIGEGDEYSWVVEHNGWEESYRKVGISENLIQQIKERLMRVVSRCKGDNDEDTEDND